MDSFLLDLRYAVRTLLRRPGFTALAVLTLAVGIGVNAVAFSAVNALLLQHFDVKDADSLGWIMTTTPGGGAGATSLPDYRDVVQGTRSFDAVVAEGRAPLSLRTQHGAEQVWALLVSADYLDVLHAPVDVGRVFTTKDLDASELPVVVSHRFWTNRLGEGGSPAGRVIVLNGRAFSVVGVLADGFQGPGGLFAPDVWVPLERREVLDLSPDLETRKADWLTVVGRLKPGVSAAQARDDVRAVFARLSSEYPATNAKRGGGFFVMSEGHPDLRGLVPVAWIGMSFVGIVLLIACFNVAGLLVARSAERQQEVAVRAALGAGQGRILRQLLTEGALLAALAGGAALLVAGWSATLLSTFSLPAPIPQRLNLGVDRRIVEFTLLLVAIAGAVPALLPALQLSRLDLVRAIKLEPMVGTRPGRIRNLFVVAQIAGSTLFLAGALLFVRSFLNAAATDPGFDAAHIATVEVRPSGHGYDARRSRLLIENLATRVSAVTGVRHVAIADLAPFFVGFAKSAEVSADGQDCSASDCRRAVMYSVSHGYFDTLGLRLTTGRDFTDAELSDGSAVVVSARLAEILWPGEAAVGRTLRIWPGPSQVSVVGVAADMKHRTMREAPTPYLYRPLGPDDFSQGLTVIVRTGGDPRQVLGALREQVRALDQELPPFSVSTMPERMKVPLWASRTAAGFFLICAVLALALAIVGLFGVTYFVVTQRTREFGLRVALGATRERVLWLVLGEGLRLALAGVIVGIALALVATRFASAMLVGVRPWDPVSFGAAAVLQALVALAACAVPAWRATRVDPMIALRHD